MTPNHFTTLFIAVSGLAQLKEDFIHISIGADIDKDRFNAVLLPESEKTQHEGLFLLGEYSNR